MVASRLFKMSSYVCAFLDALKLLETSVLCCIYVVPCLVDFECKNTSCMNVSSLILCCLLTVTVCVIAVCRVVLLLVADGTGGLSVQGFCYFLCYEKIYG